MDRTDSIIDSVRYHSCRQTRCLGEMIRAVYAWRAGYAVS